MSNVIKINTLSKPLPLMPGYIYFMDADDNILCERRIEGLGWYSDENPNIKIGAIDYVDLPKNVSRVRIVPPVGMYGE